MRLIDADAFRHEMYHSAFEMDTKMQKWDSGCWIRYKLFENCLEAAPTVDAEPVRHGRWVKGELTPDSWKFCSICRFPKAVRRAQWYYCPSCGAKMDEEENNG